MKLEYKIQDRFCTIHGCKMKISRIKDEFYAHNGALKNKYAYYKCSKWFCSREDMEYIILVGKVVN